MAAIAPAVNPEESAASNVMMKGRGYPSKAKRRSGTLEPPTGLIERLGYVRKDSVESAPFSTLIHLGSKDRKFLTAVTRGDLPTVRRMLEDESAERCRRGSVPSYSENGNSDPLLNDLNINCSDALGRSSLRIAIENENLEIVELLLQYDQIDIGDALLHAIQNDSIGSTVLILNHASKKKNLQGVFGELPSSSFTPDMTPIILAAIKDNYAIIHLLLESGFKISQPHDIRCRCDQCRCQGFSYNSLGLSRSRLNLYSALASPSLICLTSQDPLLTTFQLSSQMSQLARLEVEYSNDYVRLAAQCRQFAVDLLDQVRDTNELSTILNYDPELRYFEERQRALMWRRNSNEEPGDNEDNCKVPSLSRLKLAIKYKQKQFIAHPSCQQFLASIWYSAIPGFRQMSLITQLTILVLIGLSLPLLCLANIILPTSKAGRLISQPFIKFVCHSSSYLCFIVSIVLVSQRFNMGTFKIDDRTAIRGPYPTTTELILLAFIVGHLFEDARALWKLGFQDYLQNRWNLFTFVINNLFVCAIFLRVVTIVTRCSDGLYSTLPRRQWSSSDPNLVRECILAIAAVFACLKLISIFTVSSKIGPLQIAFGHMIADIAKFAIVYLVLLLAFSCGLSQVYWFYANNQDVNQVQQTDFCSVTIDANIIVQENSSDTSSSGQANVIDPPNRFLNLFEIIQSLYWGLFSLIDLGALDLMGQHKLTTFIGRLLFGTYSFMGMIVLVNALIAMMSDSYKKIQRQADVEWKFALAKLWLTYFEDVYDLPIPFNLLPSVSGFKALITGFSDCYRFIVAANFQWHHHSSSLSSENVFAEKDDDFFIEEIIRRNQARTLRYREIIRDLAKRYLIKRQENMSFSGVNEDDLAEIKQEIAGFKYELLEILRFNQMKIPEYINESSTSSSLSVARDNIGKFNIPDDSLGSRRASDQSNAAEQFRKFSCGGSRSSRATVETMLSRRHSLPSVGEFGSAVDNTEQPRTNLQAHNSIEMAVMMMEQARHRLSYRRSKRAAYRDLAIEPKMFHSESFVQQPPSNNDIFTISETVDF